MISTITLTRDYMRMAELAACASDDPNTKTGCVLVLRDMPSAPITGVNRFPIGIKSTPDRLERPEKYLWIEHAERDAIYNAARAGRSTLRAHAYILFSPCMDCARAFIQAGIGVVTISVSHNEERLKSNGGKWAVELEKARQMLVDAGVQVQWWLR